MKKLILIAATILLFTLTACKNNDSDISDNGHSFVTPPPFARYELKTGPQIYYIFEEFGAHTADVTKIKASSQPPASSIPQDKIKYIDELEQDVRCWLDANAKTIYYYANGVTTAGGTKKIILSPDSRLLFKDCYYVTEIDLQYFDTRKVEDMSFMFSYCRKLSSLDLSNFDTSKVNQTSYMFFSCHILLRIYVSNLFDTSSVQDSFDMFKECLLLIGGNNTTYNSDKTDKEYARIDAAGTPGYFTLKTNP